jgi:hypothetical protein
MKQSILVWLILVLSVTLCGVDTVSNPSFIIVETQFVCIHSDYLAHDPIYIEDSTNKTQFESLGFAGNGTISNPFIIEGLSIDGDDTSPCIEIRNPQAISGVTGSYFVIRDCYLYNGTYGVLLGEATVGVIEYNIIVINHSSDISWPILVVEDYTVGLEYNITIRNNHLTKNHAYNDVLIDISGPAQNVAIMNNVGMGDLGLGVQLNALVQNNTFLDISTGFNSFSAQISFVNNSMRSIYLDTFNPDAVVRVVNNTIIGGLRIKDCGNFEIHGNDIISSTFPVRLENSDNSTFTNNVFYALEGYSIFNADSASENNKIDYNFYSDYNGVDEDSDNIGDTPYLADNSLVDYHPLMSLRGFEIGVPVTSITLPTSSTSITSTTGTTTPNTSPSGAFELPPIILLSVGTGVVIAVVAIIVLKKK